MKLLPRYARLNAANTANRDSITEGRKIIGNLVPYKIFIIKQIIGCSMQTKNTILNSDKIN